LIVHHLGGFRGDHSCGPSIPPVPPMSRAFLSGHRLRGFSPAGHANQRNLNTHPARTRAGGMSPLLSRRPLVSKSPSGNHQRRVDLTTIHGSEPQVNSYPASEQRISEVERGRICNAILPMPRAKTLSAGDSIIFALAYSNAGQETRYVKRGDSVCVLLTEVTDLGATDPATGQALFRLSWNPLGQSDSPGTIAKRVVNSRRSYGRA